MRKEGLKIMDGWTKFEGFPFPLGVSWIEQEEAYNFALYSKHARGVTLLLHAEKDLVNPVYRYRLDHLKNKSARIWHCRIPGEKTKDAKYYAYIVEGPSLCIET
jgi:glycogen operon protein